MCATSAARFTIALMVSLAVFAFAMLRAGFTTAWLAIEDRSIAAGPLQHRVTVVEHGLLLAGYHIGYTVAIVPLTHWIARRRLAKSSVFYALFGCSCLLAGTPTLLAASVWLLFASRVAIGMMQAAIVPASLQLLAAWLPAGEVRPFSLIFVSVNLGMALAVFGTAKLSELNNDNGWTHTFFAPALLLFALAIGWLFLVFEGPDNHPRIAAPEREYIEGELSRGVGPTARVDYWPSMRKVTKSPTFWAALWLHFGSAWTSSFVMTGLPTFVHVCLGFGFQATVLWLSSMYAARAVFCIVFGHLADKLTDAEWIAKTVLRKTACLISHTLPGVAMFAATRFGDRPYECLACVALAFGANGAVTKTAYANMLELSPRHSGAIIALISCVASWTGILCPLAVAYFVGESRTAGAWWPILWIAAGCYVVPSLLFVIFGSAATQPWSKNSRSASATGGEIPKIIHHSINTDIYF